MKSLFAKISVGLLILIVIASVSSYCFFRYEIDQMLGGNTEIVDVEQFKITSGKIAITNVAILSRDSASILPDQTVLIEGESIVSVGQNINVPGDYFVVSGKGRYLIPGLIDSHVHIKKSSNDFLLYVANGITHIGEMTGMAHHFEDLNEIRNGRIGPTMFIASPKVNSHKTWKATFRSLFEKRHQNFINPQEGRDAVRKFKALGYDAVKLSSDLEAEIYFAINDEAKKIGIPVIGHLPVGLTLSDLYQSGQSQLAHIDSITHNLMNEFGGLYVENSEKFLQHVEAQADDIAGMFKKKGIALASTVWLHKSRPHQDFNLPGFFKTIEIEYQNPGWLEGSFVSKGCLPGDNTYENPNNTSAKGIQSWTIFYNAYNKAIEIVTKALVRHDVTITAGTDALGACGVIAGFSLHKELETLVEIGMSESQALRAATSEAASWMGVNAGVIQEGYRADLVLLNKNPLDDIRNTKSIESVIVNGKYLNRIELDKMLAAVKKSNNKSRKESIQAYSN